MEWEVRLDEEFAAWLFTIGARERDEILAHAGLLGNEVRIWAGLMSIR